MHTFTLLDSQSKWANFMRKFHKLKNSYVNVSKYIIKSSIKLIKSRMSRKLFYTYTNLVYMHKEFAIKCMNWIFNVQWIQIEMSKKELKCSKVDWFFVKRTKSDETRVSSAFYTTSKNVCLAFIFLNNSYFGIVFLHLYIVCELRSQVDSINLAFFLNKSNCKRI